MHQVSTPWTWQEWVLFDWLLVVWASLSAAPGSVPVLAAALFAAGQAGQGQLENSHSALPLGQRAVPEPEVADAAAHAVPAVGGCWLAHDQH